MLKGKTSSVISVLSINACGEMPAVLLFICSTPLEEPMLIRHFADIDDFVIDVLCQIHIPSGIFKHIFAYIGKGFKFNNHFFQAVTALESAVLDYGHACGDNHGGKGGIVFECVFAYGAGV